MLCLTSEASIKCNPQLLNSVVFTYHLYSPGKVVFLFFNPTAPFVLRANLDTATISLGAKGPYWPKVCILG